MHGVGRDVFEQHAVWIHGDIARSDSMASVGIAHRGAFDQVANVPSDFCSFRLPNKDAYIEPYSCADDVTHACSHASTDHETVNSSVGSTVDITNQRACGFTNGFAHSVLH